MRSSWTRVLVLFFVPRGSHAFNFLTLSENCKDSADTLVDIHQVRLVWADDCALLKTVHKIDMTLHISPESLHIHPTSPTDTPIAANRFHTGRSVRKRCYNIVLLQDKMRGCRH